MRQATLFNMPAFVIFCFPKIVKIGSMFNIKKYAPRSADLKCIVLKSKKLQLIFLVVLGILVYRFISSRFIGKGQKIVKSNKKDSGKKFEIIFSFIHMMDCFKYFLARLNLFSFLIKAKTDETNVGPSDYDPSIDYNKLVWKLYYEMHKGEEFAEDVKRIFESIPTFQYINNSLHREVQKKVN